MAKVILIVVAAIVTIVIIIPILLGITVGHISPTMFPTIITGMKQGDSRGFQISGHSMEPNLKAGQYWLAKPYSSTQPQRGDVVVLVDPKNSTQKIDKRIIGLPGEKIMIKKGLVYINDKPLEEPYLVIGTKTEPENFQSEGQDVMIPPENYYVMGDNRMDSLDSRSFGFVSRKDILYKLTTCYKGCQ